MKTSVSLAKQKLAGLDSWKTYCNSFTHSNIPQGTFALARHHQLQVTKTNGNAHPAAFDTPIARRTRGQLDKKFAGLILETPSKRPAQAASTPVFDELDESIMYDEDASSPFEPISPVAKDLQNVLYPPTRDEQIVNTALINFLDALTIHFPLSSNWTLHRKAFTATFEDARFEARTDGYLDDAYGSPSVTIEVKPMARAKKLVAIQMQESAQMIAWLKADHDIPEGCARTRMIISQDRHEIYLTVAEYDENYVAYLNENAVEKRPFLIMHQYGPWDTQVSNNMRELGPILLAIALRADFESKKIYEARKKQRESP